MVTTHEAPEHREAKRKVGTLDSLVSPWNVETMSESERETMAGARAA
ncbi:MAG: hypothetical protein OXI73_01875 [Rhodospirillales bacterium]|nr:hypothetical protein [Rhodospirillales bacterium]